MGSSKRRRPVSLLGAVSNHHHHGSGSHPSTWAERSRTHRRRATCSCEEAWLSRSQEISRFFEDESQARPRLTLAVARFVSTLSGRDRAATTQALRTASKDKRR